jgi:transcriptional regulator with XRE-family HTH domain
MTVETLAQMCSSSRSYITLIENSRRVPSTKLIPKIAKALNIKTATILDWYLEDMRLKMERELNLK